MREGHRKYCPHDSSMLAAPRSSFKAHFIIIKYESVLLKKSHNNINYV